MQNVIHQVKLSQRVLKEWAQNATWFAAFLVVQDPKMAVANDDAALMKAIDEKLNQIVNKTTAHVESAKTLKIRVNVNQEMCAEIIAQPDDWAFVAKEGNL